MPDTDDNIPSEETEEEITEEEKPSQQNLKKIMFENEKKEKKFTWHPTDVPLYVLWLKEKKPEMAEITIDHNMTAVIGFLTSLNPDIENIEDYNKFIIDKAIKHRNLNIYPALKYFIMYKITDASLKERLIGGLIKPKPQPTLYNRKYIKEEILIELLNLFKYKRHRIIALIQMITGIRAGDVFNIRKGGIFTEDYNGAEVMKISLVGKMKKKCVVFIHDKIAQGLIMDYILSIHEENMHEDFYFQKKNTGRSNHLVKQYNYDIYRENLKIAMRILGIPSKDFSTHDFRRCFARRVWTKYKDIHVLQHMLNHSSPSTTLTYLDSSGLKNIDYFAEMQK
jgi:integrase